MKKLAGILTALVLFCGCVCCAQAETYELSSLKVNVPDTWFAGFAEGSDNKQLIMIDLNTSCYYALTVSYDDVSKATGVSDPAVIAKGLRTASAQAEGVTDVSDIISTNGIQWFSFYYTEQDSSMAVCVAPDAKNVLTIISSGTEGIENVIKMITL